MSFRSFYPTTSQRKSYLHQLTILFSEKMTTSLFNNRSFQFKFVLRPWFKLKTTFALTLLKITNKRQGLLNELPLQRLGRKFETNQSTNFIRAGLGQGLNHYKHPVDPINGMWIELGNNKNAMWPNRSSCICWNAIDIDMWRNALQDKLWPNFPLVDNYALTK